MCMCISVIINKLLIQYSECSPASLHKTNTYMDIKLESLINKSKFGEHS